MCLRDYIADQCRDIKHIKFWKVRLACRIVKFFYKIEGLCLIRRILERFTQDDVGYPAEISYEQFFEVSNGGPVAFPVLVQIHLGLVPSVRNY